MYYMRMLPMAAYADASDALKAFRRKLRVQMAGTRQRDDSIRLNRAIIA